MKTETPAEARPSGKMDTKDLTLSIGLVLGRYLWKSESMHYGYWTDDLDVNILNLGRAQQQFTDFILSHIPKGVQRILEVGSGSGELAGKLARLGCRIDCVSPGDYLAECVRKKLNGAGTVYPVTFEEFRTAESYDLILFSESFHYIPLEILFQKLPALLVPRGRVLICNFFKKETPTRCAIRGGHRLSRFLEQLQNSDFICEEEIDITERTAPSIDLLGSAYTEVGAPLRDLVLRYARSNHPILTRLCFPVIGRLYRRKLTKFNRKLTPGLVNAKHFAEHKCYRLYLLRLKR